jgi:hypothetical protein
MEWTLMAAKSSKCKRCRSEHQSNFDAEVGIHFPGRKGLDKPLVFVFPKLVVCLDCGSTEFAIPETELRVLREEKGRSITA